MKIIKKEKEELISNFEVLSLLTHRRHMEGQVLLNEFVRSVEDYLKKTPAAKQTKESIEQCRKEISEINTGSNIMKGELLQIFNIAPSSEVEIHLVVEDCEDRIDPKELLAVVKSTLGEAVVRDEKYL